MLFSVWCHLSRAPWFWGWHVDDRYCDSNLTDISTSLVEIYLSKLKPWSDLIELGRPTSVKNLVKALTIAFTLIFLKSTVSGNLVDTHIMVNKYWFPDLVWGIGPSRPLSLLIGLEWVFFLGFQGGISSLSAVQGNGFAIKPLFLSPTTFCFCVTLNFFPGS